MAAPFLHSLLPKGKFCGRWGGLRSLARSLGVLAWAFWVPATWSKDVRVWASLGFRTSGLHCLRLRSCTWVVVKNMVPFWVPIISCGTYYLLFQVPQKEP